MTDIRAFSTLFDGGTLIKAGEIGLIAAPSLNADRP